MLAELFFPETLLLGLKMVTVSLGPYAAFPLCEHPCVFSSYQESEKVKVKLLSRVRLFATLWAVAYQAPPSMEFSRHEYWSGLQLPTPGDLPNTGIEGTSLTSLSRVRLFVTPWTVAYQAPLSVGFSRQ